MIITEQKPIQSIIDSLKEYSRIFIIGCGECATACKTGGEAEVLKMKKELESSGKTVTGSCVPSAPCIAAKLKSELSRNTKGLKEAEAVLILSCGLGVQSFKDNDRLGLAAFPALNTVFGAVMDAKGNFYEKCSMCGECVLDITGGICPVTLCAKGLLNGPCGGMNKGKCEVDKDRDCAWVLIYKELKKNNKLESLKEIRAPRDFKKSGKPHKLVMAK
ncbi:MAG: methylenetetrahydrofolate reductase C-terminal domain-containing protein [Candidatus Omnitrophota bacterium]|jgi:ferredoxin